MSHLGTEKRALARKFLFFYTKVCFTLLIGVLRPGKFKIRFPLLRWRVGWVRPATSWTSTLRKTARSWFTTIIPSKLRLGRMCC